MFAESDTVMRSLAQNLDLTFTPPKVQKIRSFGTVLVLYYKLLIYETFHRDLHLHYIYSFLVQEIMKITIALYLSS